MASHISHASVLFYMALEAILLMVNANGYRIHLSIIHLSFPALCTTEYPFMLLYLYFAMLLGQTSSLLHTTAISTWYCKIHTTSALFIVSIRTSWHPWVWFGVQLWRAMYYGGDQSIVRGRGTSGNHIMVVQRQWLHCCRCILVVAVYWCIGRVVYQTFRLLWDGLRGMHC